MLSDRLNAAVINHLDVARKMMSLAGTGKPDEFILAAKCSRLMRNRVEAALFEYGDHIQQPGYW